jgi:hypothetical protein
MNSDSIDLMIVTCDGCREERIFLPPKPIEQGTKLDEWMRKVIKPCICGTKEFTARCRITQFKN